MIADLDPRRVRSSSATALMSRNYSAARGKPQGGVNLKAVKCYTRQDRKIPRYGKSAFHVLTIV